MPSGRTALAITIGFVAGTASGLVGVGGGVVMVPGLVIGLAASQYQAHATSLAAIVPIGAVGAIVFAAHGRVDYALAGFLAIGSAAGATLGTRTMPRIPERA